VAFVTFILYDRVADCSLQSALEHSQDPMKSKL